MLACDKEERKNYDVLMTLKSQTKQLLICRFSDFLLTMKACPIQFSGIISIEVPEILY